MRTLTVKIDPLKITVGDLIAARAVKTPDDARRWVARVGSVAPKVLRDLSDYDVGLALAQATVAAATLLKVNETADDGP